MPFNTLSVATAVTPSVIETYFSHFLNRGPLRQKPTAHISYHEGLRLIRQFLEYSSKHSVEDLQAFTAQWVPAPTWVRIYDSEIAPQFLERAARLLQAQLGRRGLDKVGGTTWWQWRRPEAPLRAEWIEMKKDFSDRKKTGLKCDKCILYVHGGAYYFGSVDEHRYQMQRHARKLKARVLAPRYRLAPQFPFPCGLHDCIATYLYLLEHFRPDQILFAGDSAGGGMVLSLLVTLRDQGLPLPAGTILLSPWVDLTHSFPSVAGDGVGDYIPPHGFHHKPSMAWPPPQSDGIKRAGTMFEQPHSDAVELPVMDDIDMRKRKKRKGEKGEEEDDDERPSMQGNGKARTYNALPSMGENLSIVLDGKNVEIKEQIQLYAPNDLLSHPLVSPAMQPSLGGLPPMLIQVGGAELLRDEQIYVAHKAANPKAYPPGDAIMDEYDPRREALGRYPPTDVQLQVWEDLCHVPHTLSFTRPAKYMYRSVAQFGAWALAHAQHQGVDIRDNDDNVSIISSGPEDEGESSNASTSDLRRKKNASSETDGRLSLGAVGRAGDPIPAFRDHMIRQRVTRHGVIYNMASESEIACLALDPASIGAIKQGPVRKWMAKKREAEMAFGKDAKKLQKKKAKELALGYDEIPGETPPPTALVGRRRKGMAPEEKKKQKNWGLAMWSGWGSSHDESTLKREEKAEKDAEGRQGGMVAGQAEKVGYLRVDDNRPPTGTATSASTAIPRSRNGTVHDSTRKKRRTSSVSVFTAPWSQKQVVEDQRPRSRNHRVTDTGQASTTTTATATTEGLPRADSSTRPAYSRRSSASTTTSYASRPISMAVPTAGEVAPDIYRVPGSQNTYLDPHGSRPHNGINAYPFRLRQPASNPSIATLDSKAASTVSGRGEGLGVGGGAGAGVGASVAPVEMPAHADTHVAEMPTPANAHVEMPTPADEAYRGSEGSEEPVSAVSRSGTPQREVVSAGSAVSRSGTPQREVVSVGSRSVTPQREPVSVGSRSGTPQREPVSVGSRTSTPQRELDPVVSPETTPKTSPFRGPAAIFDNRSSLLGAIGADGMPIAPLQGRKANAAFPKASGLPNLPTASSSAGNDAHAPTTVKEPERAASFKTGHPPADARVAAAAAATEGSVNGGDSSPVTPIDGEKPAMFKIRNPVYDARVAPTPAEELEAAEKPSPEAPATREVPKKPGEATEATKAAPFKLRHTVYDPSAAFGQSLARKPSDPALPSLPLVEKDRPAPPAAAPTLAKESTEAERFANRAMTPVDQPTPTPSPAPNDLPPNSHVVMPTLVARRPIAMWQNTPPKPPPKDGGGGGGGGRMSPLAAALDRKRSKELLLSGSRDRDREGERDRDRDRKTPSPTTMMTMGGNHHAGLNANAPKSKLGGAAAVAPSIGEMGFEKTAGRGGFEFGGGGGGGEEGRHRQRPGLETFVTADEGEMRRQQQDA
ncbi:hypothetical protein B0A55_12032 [Friedmanniomyces simplex]|uniref:Alpha/beta hydrolase fold-3 domain-containing protein n=1 Tax=Friedmanniomyces simplex TaxID=329884 RepID=A0A4U0WP21_9PEZI|nr:hypothetical protein B0A55_12032 [Friedmanniomyces simplex]